MYKNIIRIDSNNDSNDLFPFLPLVSLKYSFSHGLDEFDHEKFIFKLQI
jgi:hypothetical protein